jgi:hypothetical protein
MKDDEIFHDTTHDNVKIMETFVLTYDHEQLVAENELLRKAARLIHDRHGMVSGSLEMAECDAACKAAGLEPWTWPIVAPNAKVSGAGTASAGLPGYAPAQNGERE